MEALSPITRRIVALGLLVLAVVSGLNLAIVPMFAWAGAALTELGDARFERAQAEAVIARAPPTLGTPLERRSYVEASNAVVAGQALGGLVQRVARASGVQVDGVTPAGTPAAGLERLAAARITVQGTERAIVTFIDTLEQGEPVARLRDWRIAKSETGQTLRLSGLVVVAWGKRA